MRHVYSFFSKTLMLMALIAFTHSVNAQIQGVTTVTNSGTCTELTANFNSDDNGFNPAVSGNSPMYFNLGEGWWSEVDGVSATPAIPLGGNPRLIALNSPLYKNPSPVGIFDVGFYYVVPNPAVNRFQVRIIASTIVNGITVTNVAADSGPRFFANHSTPAPYTGDAPQVSGFEGTVCIRLLDTDITNAPNTAYRVEVTYEISEPLFTVFDDLSLGAVAAAPLPVHFLGLGAKKVTTGIEVMWDVADEVDVKEYQLERSTTGAAFTTVGVVAAENKSNVYSFVDPYNKSGNVYYRVKSVDLDGQIKYSGIIRFKNGTSFSSSLEVYPSPARSQITIQHDKLEGKGKISINTIDGRLLKMVNPSQGISNTMVDVSSLSAGTYIIKLDNGEGKIETIKFVKQ